MRCRRAVHVATCCVGHRWGPSHCGRGGGGGGGGSTNRMALYGKPCVRISNLITLNWGFHIYFQSQIQGWRWRGVASPNTARNFFFFFFFKTNCFRVNPGLPAATRKNIQYTIYIICGNNSRLRLNTQDLDYKIFIIKWREKCL